MVSKICKPDGPQSAGEQATCDIIVDNAGPSGARNVTLTDELVSDGTFTTVSADASQGSCAIDGNGDVDCNLEDIDAGERVTVVVTVEADDTVDVNDKATATSDTLDPNTGNNMDEGSVSFVALADLGIEKTGSIVEGAKKTTVEYVLTVENFGPSVAQNVVVTDNLPTTGKNNEPVEVVSVSGDCI